MKEYVIWGIPLGKSEEEVLYTQCKSEPHAQVTLNNLVGWFGVTKGRIQTLDTSECPSKLFKSKELINV